jgi:hypothetical protein
MPCRSKYKPVESKVEVTTDIVLIRKYMEVYGCTFKDAKEMLSARMLKAKMNKLEIYI